MPAYSLIEFEVLDQEGAARYSELEQSAVTRYGGHLRAGSPETVVAEGDWPPQQQVSVVEFPDMDRLRTWYSSPEHAQASQIAHTSVRRRMIFLDAVGAPDTPGEGDAATFQRSRRDGLVRDFYDAFYNAKDYERARSMLAEGLVNHHPGVPAGREGTIDAFRQQVGGPMPDFAATIQDLAAEGDLVWVRSNLFGGGRPLGTMVDIWRLEGDLLAELWDYSASSTDDT